MADIDIKDSLLRFKVFFSDMTDTMLVIYTEKGIEPFKKPLFVTLPLLLLLYVGVYRPLSSKVGNAVYEIERGRAISEGAGDYEDAKARLAASQRKLAPAKEKDDWINTKLTDISKLHNIPFDGISEQTEEESGNYLMVSRQVQFTCSYASMARLLAALENSRVFLRVTTLVATKDPDTGRLKVILKLSTIFAKKGGD